MNRILSKIRKAIGLCPHTDIQWQCQATDIWFFAPWYDIPGRVPAITLNVRKICKQCGKILEEYSPKAY